MKKKSETTQSSGANSQSTIVFFGNEKLVTGGTAKPIIQQALKAAGFEIEKSITDKLSTLGEHRSQLAVLAAYGKIIPQRVLDEFPLGIINVHPSLLPTYRGPTPIESAILEGAQKTGVSIMRLTAGMDEGPIYIQRTVHLNGTETKQELAETLQKLGAELLTGILPKIVAQQITPRQQPHPVRATYSHKITKAQGVLNFGKPAVRLEREVRAYTNWPKSSTTIAGIEVVVLKATVDPSMKGNQGEMFKTPDKKIGVYCSEGALIITELKPAGRQAMTSEGFLAGYGKDIRLRS